MKFSIAVFLQRRKTSPTDHRPLIATAVTYRFTFDEDVKNKSRQVATFL